MMHQLPNYADRYKNRETIWKELLKNIGSKMKKLFHKLNNFSKRLITLIVHLDLQPTFKRVFPPIYHNSNTKIYLQVI